MIYLDWAATAKPNTVLIREAVEESFAWFANPSAVHGDGKKAKMRKEEAREKIASLLKCSPNELIFTSGATETSQIIFTSLINHPFKNEIIISDREHAATREMARSMKMLGYEVKVVESKKDGFVTVESLLKLINDKTAIISLIFVDNETGAIEPIIEIGEAVKKIKINGNKPHFHVDCVQGLGKIPIDLSLLPIDSASFSAHKIGGMRGIGLLYLKNAISPFLRGGGQERGVRSGTENLAGIISFEKCLNEAYPLIEERGRRASSLMSFLIAELKQVDEIKIVCEERANEQTQEQQFNFEDVGTKRAFSPYILSFYNIHLKGEVLVRMMGDLDIAISFASSCSSNSREKHVFVGVPHQYRENVVRLSIGWDTTKEELEVFIRALKEIMGAVTWK